MSSFNIITARVSPPPSPAVSRSNSISNIGLSSHSQAEEFPSYTDYMGSGAMRSSPATTMTSQYDDKHNATEETPLVGDCKANRRAGWWHTLPKGIVSSIISSIRWVFATLASPGVYLIACFYNEQGLFAPWTQLKALFGFRKAGVDKLAVEDSYEKRAGLLDPADARSSRRPDLSSHPSNSSSAVTSDSDSDEPRASARHTRSTSLQPSDDGSTARKTRIKLQEDPKRRHRKTQSAVTRTKAGSLASDELSAQLKSPTSPMAALTKYPRAPAPPRPLIPRRQPSYLNMEPPTKPQKTLILDLDETLIHSMSKGGRMSTGHMVEVRLNAASLGMPGQSNVGQHPILYWVQKRPYCDEFLRRVCKWYNLVVFTASVQEYADPVIDWLEQERKFFSARYYRQHCTYRQGAYIKDLSSVEPDLSNVMILDNSPLSYLFHEGMFKQRHAAHLSARH